MLTKQIPLFAVLAACAALPATALAGAPANPGAGHKPAPTPTAVSNPGTAHLPDGVAPSVPAAAAGAADQAAPDDAPAAGKAYGKLCASQSKLRTAGQSGTPFSRCVAALAKVAAGATSNPQTACKGLSKRHVKGEKGTPFSRCVAAAAKVLADTQGDPAPSDDPAAPTSDPAGTDTSGPTGDPAPTPTAT
jgi:hypothetical protein